MHIRKFRLCCFDDKTVRSLHCLQSSGKREIFSEFRIRKWAESERKSMTGCERQREENNGCAEEDLSDHLGKKKYLACFQFDFLYFTINLPSVRFVCFYLGMKKHQCTTTKKKVI